MTPEEVINTLQLDLREIKTLLTERTESVKINAINISEAVKDIRTLERNLSDVDAETHKFGERMSYLEQRMESLEKSNLTLGHTVQGLRDAQIKMSIISSLATAVLTAIVIKFVVG
jgi:chromosome segregation ATPase